MNFLKKLLVNIQHSNLTKEERDTLLKCDPRIMKAIKDLKYNDLTNAIEIINAGYETVDEVLSGINILKKTKKNPKAYPSVVHILTSDVAISNDVALTGARMLLSATTDYNAEFASLILTSTNAINNMASKRGSKLAFHAPKRYNALYVYLYLDNPYAYVRGNPLEMAEKLASGKEEFNCRLAYEILVDEKAIIGNTNIKGANIILKCHNKFSAEYCYMLLASPIAIKHNWAIRGAEIISKENDEFKAQFLYKLLASPGVYEKGNVEESTKLILGSQNETMAESIYETLNNPVINNRGIQIDGAKIIATSRSIEIAKVNYRVLNDRRISNEFAIKCIKYINESLCDAAASYIGLLLANEILNPSDEEFIYLLSRAATPYQARSIYLLYQNPLFTALNIIIPCSKILLGIDTEDNIKLVNDLAIGNKQAIYNEMYKMVLNNIEVSDELIREFNLLLVPITGMEIVNIPKENESMGTRVLGDKSEK